MRTFLFIALILSGSLVCSAQDCGPKPLVDGRLPKVTWIERLQGVNSKPFTFFTPYGDIAKGALMSEVMDVFGMPLSISTSDNTETWEYVFGDDQHILVNFVNSGVFEVVGITED